MIVFLIIVCPMVMDLYDQVPEQRKISQNDGAVRQRKETFQAGTGAFCQPQIFRKIRGGMRFFFFQRLARIS